MPKWWPFGKEKTSVVDEEALFLQHEAVLRRRFDEALANGHPRQQLLFQIEQESSKLEQEAQVPEAKAKLRAYDLLYSEIRPRMMANLTNGKNHEMAGQIEEAVQSFHAAAKDHVPTRFPYEHLRVIYFRQQKLEKARQICKDALQNPYLSDKDHDHFKKWIAKLETAVSE